MHNGYFINPLAVVFCPDIDKENNFRTIVCNPTTENILKINRVGYNILQTIEEKPGVSVEEISTLLLIDTSRIERFLDEMKKENIIFVK